MTDPIDRIAAALERLAPPPPPSADPLAHPAYVWRGDGLTAARQFAPLPLAMLHGVEMQKAALIANLERLAARHAAQDVLMWGARDRKRVVSGKRVSVRVDLGGIVLIKKNKQRISINNY